MLAPPPPPYFLKIITFFNYSKIYSKNPAKPTITFIYTVTTAAKETNAAIKGRTLTTLFIVHAFFLVVAL